MAAIKVKLVHGLSGIPASHRTTVVGLGLKKTQLGRRSCRTRPRPWG